MRTTEISNPDFYRENYNDLTGQDAAIALQEAANKLLTKEEIDKDAKVVAGRLQMMEEIANYLGIDLLYDSIVDRPDQWVAVTYDDIVRHNEMVQEMEDRGRW